MSIIKEYCGIFGVYGHKEASQLTYLGLYALQHRGQESAGIVVSDGKQFRYHKEMGLVTDVFNQEILDSLEGHMAIGHVRYSTAGSSALKNAQPFVVEHFADPLAIGHNGNLTNTFELRTKLEKEGSIFQSTMDTEVIIHLMARSKKTKWEDKLADALKSIKGAYSLVFLSRNKLIAARDPYGFKPLALAKKDDAYFIASETCAFDLIQAEYIRDIEPGEILIIDQNGLKSIKPFPKTKHAYCIFEYIYFSRPDSNIFGGNVYQTRKNLGRQLAKENKIQSDLVVPVPDSGICAGLGYSEESKIPFELAIVRNHYVGRTFIQPSQFMREAGVKIKLNPVKEAVKGKRLVIVEDSVVRGTTSKRRVQSLRDAGAKEIHMCVSCPPHRYPCFYGIDFPTRKELIANQYELKDIAKFIGADSLNYLSYEGMLKSMPVPENKFCTACFNGKYPIPVKNEISKLELEG